MKSLDELEAIARAATPGEWKATRYGFVESPSGDVCQFWAKTEEDFDNHSANAAHIAAMSPDTVLKLIAVAKAAVAWHENDDSDDAATITTDLQMHLAICELRGIDPATGAALSAQAGEGRDHGKG